MSFFNRTFNLLALILVFLTAPSVSASPGFTAGAVPVSNSKAIEAYRSGDYVTAETLWKGMLDEQLSSEERGRVLYNIGNAVYRQERLTESIAWYTSCVRTTPRNRSAWNNLEFTRREAALEPADRGDLRSTVGRLLSSIDRSEAGWMMLYFILAWGVVLTIEALRGGAIWRRLSLIGAMLVLVSAAPLAWQISTASVNPVMVMEQPAAGLRTEPGEDRTIVAQVNAGVIVERIDELGDWVRIETELGERGWTLSSSVFELQ